MSNSRLARRAAILALPLLCGACEWFTDFKKQPSIKPWGEFSTDSGELKGFRGQPQNSVSTSGSFAPGFLISHDASLATVDSFSKIRNPVPADARSLANGRMYYSINCGVCHGDLGDGNGTLKQLNPAYGFPPNLLLDVTKNRTDGYIWGKIRNGGPLMPNADRIEEMDRWDVVNYLRGLQGKLPQPVATGPVGRPGETGDKLPGYTQLGPTVPSKFFHLVVMPHPAAAVPADSAPTSGAWKNQEVKKP